VDELAREVTKGPRMNALNLLKLVSVLALVVLIAAPARAEPTNIIVRVVSRDAKFIGTSMGGALITLRDANTGEVLAEGKTEGGTGDTDRMMKQSQTRRDLLSSGDDAKFFATLDIGAPRLVEVVAVGPLAKKDNANRVSATQWVLPGKHLSGGDGWVLEMPGFFIDVKGPPPVIALQGSSQAIELKADIKMMCGCPIEPGGLWDANQYEVKAQLKRDGKIVDEASMKYAGTASKFAVSFNASVPGNYEALVSAYDAHNGNTGLDTIKFRLNAN